MFAALAQGLLTDRYLQGAPADSRAATSRVLNKNSITEEYLQHARALNGIAEQRWQSLAQPEQNVATLEGQPHLA